MKASTASPTLASITEELSGPLLRYLGRLAGDGALAEDLLQETLMRIARGLPGFDRRGSVRRWAFTIATRVAADHFRKPANRVRIVEMDENAEPPDPGLAADRGLVIDEMNACVRRVIDSLPADYRAALVLHDLEGQTAASVAEICGTTLAGAKIRIHRARARLRAALDAECEFYRDEENVFRCDQKADAT